MPAVSISIGIKALKQIIADNCFSKFEMIMPVNVAESISSISQGIRFFTVSPTPVRI